MSECEAITFKACVSCHALIDTSAKFCCFCGIEQKNNENKEITKVMNHFIICPSCKQEIDREAAKFCPVCGYQIMTPIVAPAPLAKEQRQFRSCLRRKQMRLSMWSGKGSTNDRPGR
jgi:RNA polymerase subunit RPABC4/transcription elongation factor Spt4